MNIRTIGSSENNLKYLSITYQHILNRRNIIIFSHISGITLLGVPSEVYQYGSQYAACVITSILSCFISAYVFLPIFFKLQLTSTFEYLEVRFSRRVRILCSLLFLISLMMYIPIVIYVPALAFSQVTDLSLHAITPVLCAVCILYTSIVSRYPNDITRMVNLRQRCHFEISLYILLNFLGRLKSCRLDRYDPVYRYSRRFIRRSPLRYKLCWWSIGSMETL